jgi:hypothetical protein
MLEHYPGLFLTGNGYYGFGISDCIRGAKTVSDKIVKRAGLSTLARPGLSRKTGS